MANKEATARIKINKLLEKAGSEDPVPDIRRAEGQEKDKVVITGEYPEAKRSGKLAEDKFR